VLIENSQGFETFELLKSFIRKLFLTYFLKDFLEKTKYQNIIFFILFKLMQACLQRNELQNVLRFKKLHF
jgi:hypothetical protein